MDYTRYQDKVATKLAEYGAQITITKEGVSSYDPVTGAATSSSSSFTAAGLALEISREYAAAHEVLEGDRLFMFPSDADIEVGDVLDISGENWRVAVSEPFAPGGAVIYQNIQVRR